MSKGSCIGSLPTGPEVARRRAVGAEEGVGPKSGRQVANGVVSCQLEKHIDVVLAGSTEGTGRMYMVEAYAKSEVTAVSRLAG